MNEGLSARDTASSLQAVPAGMLLRRHRAVERRRLARALGFLALPVLFVGAAYLLPIVIFLAAAVDNRPVAAALPRLNAVIRTIPADALPVPEVFLALTDDLRGARDARRIAALAGQLEQAMPGMRLMVNRAARNLARPNEDARAALIAADARWGEVATWQVLRREFAPVTPRHLLAALDMTRAPNGSIAAVVPDQRVFIEVILRSVTMAVQVTLGALVLGFPVAYLLASSPPRRAALLMFLVLLPFWTSLLVRTAAWAILLEERGAVNGLLMAAGLTETPLKLMYNRLGVVIAMVYVALPFMILPLHATMKGIPAATMRAAAAHGATPLQAFRLVYLPQAMPGIVAGSVTVCVTTVGYYVTPLLIGGPGDQMLSYFIAFFVNGTLNWPMAAALAVILLVLVLAGLALLLRLVGLRAMLAR